MTLMASALEREPLGEYKSRRLRLSGEVDGVIVLFAAPAEDLVEYQQENNFYYLTRVRRARRDPPARCNGG